MEIIIKQTDSVEVVEVTGRLDVTGSQKAQELIVPHIPKNGMMVLDLSNCAYVASSGLRVLLITAKQSAAAGCKTVLAGVQPMVWEVIVMTGFEDVLEAYPSQEEAVKALKAGAGK